MNSTHTDSISFGATDPIFHFLPATTQTPRRVRNASPQGQNLRYWENKAEEVSNEQVATNGIEDAKTLKRSKSVVLDSPHWLSGDKGALVHVTEAEKS